MENKVENKGSGGKVAIVGAVITAVAGIITTIVSISGPIVDKRLAIQTTQTREAFLIEATSIARAAANIALTPTLTLPAAAAIPTTTQPAADTQPALPAAATFTPASTSPEALPEASSTPSETMLKVGDSWTVGNGLVIQLENIEFLPKNQIRIHFAFTNTSKKVMEVKVNHTHNVTMTDDKGNVYQWSTDFNWEITSYPGTTRKDTVVKSGDVSRADYFIVKLELPWIGSMQWRN